MKNTTATSKMNKQLQPLVGKPFVHKNMKGQITKVEALSEGEIALHIDQGKKGRGLCKIVAMFWGENVPVKCATVEQKNYSVGDFLLDARIGRKNCLTAVGTLLTS